MFPFAGFREEHEKIEREEVRAYFESERKNRTSNNVTTPFDLQPLHRAINYRNRRFEQGLASLRAEEDIGHGRPLSPCSVEFDRPHGTLDGGLMVAAINRLQRRIDIREGFLGEDSHESRPGHTPEGIRDRLQQTWALELKRMQQSDSETEDEDGIISAEQTANPSSRTSLHVPSPVGDVCPANTYENEVYIDTSTNKMDLDYTDERISKPRNLLNVETEIPAHQNICQHTSPINKKARGGRFIPRGRQSDVKKAMGWRDNSQVRDNRSASKTTKNLKLKKSLKSTPRPNDESTLRPSTRAYSRITRGSFWTSVRLNDVQYANESPSDNDDTLQALKTNDIISPGVRFQSVLRAFSRPLLQRSIHFSKPCLSYRLLSTDQSRSLSTCQQIHDLRSRLPTSLSWVQLYTKCPTSFGVGTPDGYCEMISQDSTSPIQKSANLENVFSHTPNALFPIYYRHTPRDALVFINSVDFSGLVIGKEGEVTMRVTMRLGQNLIGHFKVEDMQNRKVVAIDFDGTLAVCPSQDQLVVM